MFLRKLKKVGVVEIIGPDQDGDLLCRPINSNLDDDFPKIYLKPNQRTIPTLGNGDHALVRLEKQSDHSYTATVIRKINKPPNKLLGILIKNESYFQLRPINKKDKYEVIIQEADMGSANIGELVRVEFLAGKKFGLRQARVVERLSKNNKHNLYSIIAIHQHEIPFEFPKELIQLTNEATICPFEGRVDLRKLPLVTIDGPDAKDFDDAVWAEPDKNPNNRHGWHLIVAIADVAWYVRSEDLIDKEAQKRGNSTYFPDMVVPMLPDHLSNNLCSLLPNQDRPCIAVHMRIDEKGKLKHSKFVRGIMRSSARLTYEQVQNAKNGSPDKTTKALLNNVIKPLFGAYEALVIARDNRQALKINLSEKSIQFKSDGSILNISERPRLNSHQLIEEFMILANVSAATTLEKKQKICMYRVHQEPSLEKIRDLAQFLSSIGTPSPNIKGLETSFLNKILTQTKNSPKFNIVNQMILRAQSKAEYKIINTGHFGLALEKYCHFTSPIRRYSDLIVHRALIEACKLGEGGLSNKDTNFDNLGKQISMTERRSVTAERSATDRFIAKYLASKIGVLFEGEINSVTKFGIFVTLKETGADGLIPMRNLPRDFYNLNTSDHSLIGRKRKKEYRIGQSIMVYLIEANHFTGGLIFSITKHKSTNQNTNKRIHKKR